MQDNGRTEILERIERLIVRKLDGELTESEQLELDRAMLRSAEVQALYESYCKIDDLAAVVIQSCTQGSTVSTVNTSTVRTSTVNTKASTEFGETVSEVRRTKQPVFEVQPELNVQPAIKVSPEGVAAPPRHHAWMVYASALAACLALVLIWQTPDASAPRSVSNLPRSADRIGAARTGADQDVLNQIGPNRTGQGSVGGGWPAKKPRLVPTMVGPTNPVLGREIGVWSASELPAQRLDRFTNQNLIVIPSENGGYYLFSIDHVRQVRQPKAQADSLLWNKPI